MLVPDRIYITATVDIDDIEEVLDRYIHRLTQLQVEEGLPFYGSVVVSVVQTAERLARLLAEYQEDLRGHLVGRSPGSSDSPRDRRPGSVPAAQYEP